ncbi:phosphotransferase family protein [Microlunatus elymi]|nr:aminoglycoside phosphotransferase family protein [Microlunatus elymi]
MTIRDLVADSGLPSIQHLEALTGGARMDNKLTLVTLTNGQQLLARKPIAADDLQDQAPRSSFLAQLGIGFPKVYATAPDGSSLVEWIPGVSFADRLAAPETTPDPEDVVWTWLGESLAAVHAVTFPQPLQGPVGPTELTLKPQDPVDDLLASLNRARSWITQRGERPANLPDRLTGLLDKHAESIRAEHPCLLHGDNNLDNFIVTEHGVRVIDWDYPEVGYPLAELSALDEHAYLNGLLAGLPQAFWRGYGRTYPRELILLYRAIGCINWLTQDNWRGFQTDPAISDTMKQKLHRWHGLLTSWIDTLPDLLR